MGLLQVLGRSVAAEPWWVSCSLCAAGIRHTPSHIAGHLATYLATSSVVLRGQWCGLSLDVHAQGVMEVVQDAPLRFLASCDDLPSLLSPESVDLFQLVGVDPWAEDVFILSVFPL